VGNSRKGKVNREGEGRQTWLINFVYVYENGTMKSIEIVLKRGKGDKGE
jgi:hypothetical protein